METREATLRASNRGTIVWAATLAICALLAACGGTAEQGAGVAGASAGTVAGFGSVTVNGVRYDNNAADVVIGGVHGFSVDNLAVGMRVTVRGPMDAAAGTGTAQTILVEREIRGPLDDNGVDNALNRLRIMGQQVTVSPGTWLVGFDNLFALQALQPDNGTRPALEVHGMRDGAGVLRATFARKTADVAALSEPVFLRGAVSGHDFAAKTFRIGGQSVDYAAATLVLPPPLTRLDNNLVVDVAGTLQAFGGGGTLAASRVEVDNAAVGRPGDRVRLDGRVVSGTSSSFVMNGPRGPVAVSAGGVVPSGGAFAAGARVLAEGSLSGATLVASKLAVRSPNAVTIEGTVSTVNAVLKTFRMLGKTIAADPFTEYKDRASGTGLPKRTFGFGDIDSTGTFRVVGSFDPGGNRVNAARVERLGTAPPAPPNLVVLQGVVDFEDPAGGTLAILGTLGVGVSIDVQGGTTLFFDAGHAPFPFPAMTNFFNAVQPGTTVVRVRNGIAGAAVPVVITGTGPAPMEAEIVRVDD